MGNWRKYNIRDVRNYTQAQTTEVLKTHTCACKKYMHFLCLKCDNIIKITKE